MYKQNRSENVRLTDTKKAPGIIVISGVISFGNPFGNLYPEKHRFTDASYLTLEKS